MEGFKEMELVYVLVGTCERNKLVHQTRRTQQTKDFGLCVCLSPSTMSCEGWKGSLQRSSS